MKKTDIAKFETLTNDNGLISLKLDLIGYESTNINFHIDELRDFMFELNTNIDEFDKIDIKIDTYTFTGGETIPCIKLTTQDGFTEEIFQDDDFFFVDFLKLDIK